MHLVLLSLLFPARDQNISVSLQMVVKRGRRSSVVERIVGSLAFNFTHQYLGF